MQYPAALIIHGETVQNKFPGWHDILKGSRNSNVNERIDARFKFKVSKFTQDTINSMTNNDRQSAQDEDSSDDSDIEVTMPSPQPSTCNTIDKGTPLATNAQETQPHRSLFSDKKVSQSTEHIKRQAPPKPVQTPPVSPKQRQPRHLSIYTPSSTPDTDQNARPPDTDRTVNVSPHDPSS